jgi:hypothetical protein
VTAGFHSHPRGSEDQPLRPWTRGSAALSLRVKAARRRAPHFGGTRMRARGERGLGSHTPGRPAGASVPLAERAPPARSPLPGADALGTRSSYLRRVPRREDWPAAQPGTGDSGRRARPPSGETIRRGAAARWRVGSAQPPSQTWRPAPRRRGWQTRNRWVNELCTWKIDPAPDRNSHLLSNRPRALGQGVGGMRAGASVGEGPGAGALAVYHRPRLPKSYYHCGGAHEGGTRVRHAEILSTPWQILLARGRGKLLLVTNGNAHRSVRAGIASRKLLRGPIEKRNGQAFPEFGGRRKMAAATGSWCLCELLR